MSMTKRPFVSVVIPSFNMAAYLPDAVNSVLNQTYRNYELIVVDDGSTDNTAEVVDSFSNKVNYQYQENSGVSVARNQGIQLAKGDYIAFLDADDLWSPVKLERQIEALNRFPNLGLVGCGYTVRDLSCTHMLSEIIRRNYPSREQLYEALSISQIIPGCASGVLIKKQCFDHVGLFDPTLKIGEDWDMWLRIVSKYDAFFVEKILVTIRQSYSKTSIRTPSHEEMFVSKVIEKSVPRKYQKRAYAALFARLGSNDLTANRGVEGRKHLVESIRFYPFRIFPPDRKNTYSYPKIPRYYLLFKSFFPDPVNRLLKALLVRCTKRKSEGHCTMN
jgi:glycosyltransferase involved in cell wall biosynthesis